MTSDRRPVLLAHAGAELYGSDRVLLESVSAFVDAGHPVTVTVPSAGPLVAAIEARGARVVFCPTPVVRKSVLRPSGMLTFLRDTARGLRRGGRLVKSVDPGLIYVNTLTIPLWLVIAKMRGIPSICHVHEGESSARRIVRIGLAAPLLLATKVIANSTFSVGVLASAFRRFAGTEIVPNAVPGPPSPTPGRDSVADGLRVVYVGRMSPRKGVDVAVDAVALLRQRGVGARLDLVGSVFSGYEWYETELRERVHTAGLDDAVIFHGFVDDVWGRLADGDVLVVPSRIDEPFGNTAVEGILAGRPVVASATSGLMEATAGFGAAHTVPADDPAALAEVLAGIADRWTDERTSAWEDSIVATERHSPEQYRRHILQVASAATGTDD